MKSGAYFQQRSRPPAQNRLTIPVRAGEKNVVTH